MKRTVASIAMLLALAGCSSEVDLGQNYSNTQVTAPSQQIEATDENFVTDMDERMIHELGYTFLERWYGVSWDDPDGEQQQLVKVKPLVSSQVWDELKTQAMDQELWDDFFSNRRTQEIHINEWSLDLDARQVTFSYSLDIHTDGQPSVNSAHDMSITFTASFTEGSSWVITKIS